MSGGSADALSLYEYSASGSDSEDFVDAMEEPLSDWQRGDVSTRAFRSSDLADLEKLLEAVSLAPSEWPEPSTLGSAWRPDSFVPQLSLPDDASESAMSELGDEEEFDPERTPRPPQRRDSTRYSAMEKTPPSMWVGEFPCPPPRMGAPPPTSAKFKESYFEGPGDVEEEDWLSDVSSSPMRSPTHSRNGSSERNMFRWSSSTTSTVLTMPLRSPDICDIQEEEEEAEDRHFFTTRPLHIRRTSAAGLQRRSIDYARRPAVVAPPLIRSHTEPPQSKSRRSKEPEWNELIDALFGIEPRPAPRPPVWQERDLPPIPTMEEKRKLSKKASTASIKAAMSVNGAFPFLSKRTTSLKRAALAAQQQQQLPSVFDW